MDRRIATLEQVAIIKQALRDAGWLWVVAVWRPWGYGFAGKRYCERRQDYWMTGRELSNSAIALPIAGHLLVANFEESWDTRETSTRPKEAHE